MSTATMGVSPSITETRAKFKNLLRDPRCSVLVSHADWWKVGFYVSIANMAVWLTIGFAWWKVVGFW